MEAKENFTKFTHILIFIMLRRFRIIALLILLFKSMISKDRKAG